VNAKVHVKDISQMVWAGIWLGGRTELIIMERDEESRSGRGYTAKSYIETLEKGLLPIYTPGIVFQQDNAKIHLAKDTKKWFETHGVYVEDWPAHSPDLNPIEPVWRWLKLKLFELFLELIDQGRSEADWLIFKKCLVEAWNALDQSKIDALILSMGRRLEAVRKAKGYYTKY
jgi:transposase